MIFGAILPLEVDEPKHKGDKSVFKLYRVFPLPRFYLGELSCGNFGAIPQPNLGKKASYCGNTERKPRVGPAANGSIVLGGTVDRSETQVGSQGLLIVLFSCCQQQTWRLRSLMILAEMPSQWCGHILDFTNQRTALLVN